LTFVRGDTVSVRVGAVCGLLSVALFSVLYCVAVSQDPGYEFLEDYLSDLGVGPGAWAFNSALVLSGALVIIFAYFGVAPLVGRSWPAREGPVLLGVAGILLAAVGIFNEDYGRTHFAFSVSFFLVLLVALGVISYALHDTGALGAIGTGATALTFASGLILLVMGLNPLTETVAVFMALAWGGLSALLMFVRSGGGAVPRRGA